jgi:hypothetical protein
MLTPSYFNSLNSAPITNKSLLSIITPNRAPDVTVTKYIIYLVSNLTFELNAIKKFIYHFSIIA